MRARGERDARHLLGILAEDGKLLQHETYLAVLRNELGEVGRSFPAIQAIIVEEGDTLTSPFGLPATKLDFAWKICSARLAIPLSCRAWRMAGDGIGQDRAGERGQAPKAGADEGGARQRLRRQA